MKLKYSWKEVLEFVHLDIKCRYCFFIFFPFLDFLLVSKLNLNLLILPEVVFIRRTSQYGSFFSEWDFTRLGKWNHRKQASKRSSMQNYKFIHLEKHLKEKRLSCHWPAFQFNSMYLVRPFPFVPNVTWSKISPRQTQQGCTGVSFLQRR